MRELKSGFVDGSCIEHGRLSHLKDLRSEIRVVTAIRQRKAVDAVVLGDIMIVVVARDERIFGVYREVNAWAETREARRQNHALSNLDNVESRIQNCRPDQAVVVEFVAVQLQKE